MWTWNWVIYVYSNAEFSCCGHLTLIFFFSFPNSKFHWGTMFASTAAGRSSEQQQQQQRSAAASSTTPNDNTVRSQPTVPYQLWRRNQDSPSRSVFSSSSSVAGSNAGPTTSRCSCPANPCGSGWDSRLVRRQRSSPPDGIGSPERSQHPPLSEGNVIICSQWKLSQFSILL